MNTTSQDEDNYGAILYEAALRFAINSAGYGATLIFPGEELGLRGTIVPPNGNPTNNTPFGYDRFQINFGKPIPGFRENYNSMMPLWRLLGKEHRGRRPSARVLCGGVAGPPRRVPALRSENAWFLNLKARNAPENQIFRRGQGRQAGRSGERRRLRFR